MLPAHAIATAGEASPEHHHYSYVLFLCFPGHCDLSKLPNSITPALGFCAGPASPRVLGAVLGATIPEEPKQENIQKRDMRIVKGAEGPYEEQLRASSAWRRLRSDLFRICSFISMGQVQSLLSVTRTGPRE